MKGSVGSRTKCACACRNAAFCFVQPIRLTLRLLWMWSVFRRVRCLSHRGLGLLRGALSANALSSFAKLWVSGSGKCQLKQFVVGSTRGIAPALAHSNGVAFGPATCRTRRRRLCKTRGLRILMRMPVCFISKTRQVASVSTNIRFRCRTGGCAASTLRSVGGFSSTWQVPKDFGIWTSAFCKWTVLCLLVATSSPRILFEHRVVSRYDIIRTKVAMRSYSQRFTDDLSGSPRFLQTCRMS